MLVLAVAMAAAGCVSSDGQSADAGDGGNSGPGGTMVGSGGSIDAGADTRSGDSGSGDAPGSGGSGSGGAPGSGGSGSGGASGSGGQGGHGTGGAGSGGATYEPCPKDGTACRVLPLGDSITWGYGHEGGYRIELFGRAIGAAQKMTFTGSLQNGPTTVAGQAFPRSNEGHSGWTIAQLSGVVPNPAFNPAPHIILLMIGTNDVYASSGQATMPDRLASLMDKIITAAPNALLVVAKITPLGWNTATLTNYNNAIPGLVATRVAAGKHVMLVDMHTGFTSAMLASDSVHPNQSGYKFMGGIWYDAIRNLLPR